MKYTNEQLKQTLAKVLPEKLVTLDEPFKLIHCDVGNGARYWKDEVLDTELLHLCWLVEEMLTIEQQITYLNNLYREPSVENNTKWKIHPDCHATWQQRTVALAQTLGIEIV